MSDDPKKEEHHDAGKAEEHHAPDKKELENMLKQAGVHGANHGNADDHHDEGAHGKGHKKEQKPLSPLEEIIHGTSNAIKAGLAFAVPYSFANSVPSMARDVAVLSGAQIASDATISYKKGKKYTAGNLLESTVLGTATTPVIETMFRITNSVPTNSLLGYAAKGAVWGGIMYPAFVASYQPLAYLIRNKTFKGMGKYLKENYWPSLKNAWTKLLPFSLLNIFFAPSWLQIPISAALSYAFDLFGAPQKDEVPEHMKRDKTPYLAATYSAAQKLGKNVFYGVPKAAYEIGKGITDGIYKVLGGAKSGSSASHSAPAAHPAPAEHHG